MNSNFHTTRCRLAFKDKKCESAALSALVAHSEYCPIPAQAFLKTLEDADCQRVALGVMGIVENRWSLLRWHPTPYSSNT